MGDKIHSPRFVCKYSLKLGWGKSEASVVWVSLCCFKTALKNVNHSLDCKTEGIDLILVLIHICHTFETCPCLLYSSQFLWRWPSTLLSIESPLVESIQQSQSTAPRGRKTRSLCPPQLFLFLTQSYTHTHTWKWSIQGNQIKSVKSCP